MAESRERDEILRGLTEAGAQPAGGTGTVSAMRWIRNKFNELLRGSSHKPLTKKAAVGDREFPLLDNSSFVRKLNQSYIGKMFMFVYDPKTKAKLPYYDTFPLVLVINTHDDGFTGLNLHYVPPLLRVRILEALVANINFDKLEKNFKTRTTESRQILNNFRTLQSAAKMPILKPCFKKYLFSHVRSSMLFVDPKEWPKAVLLPTERFKKASKTKVYENSMQAAGVSTGRPKSAARYARQAQTRSVEPKMTNTVKEAG